MPERGLKMDLTALAMVRQIMVKYAIDILDRKKIFELLKKPHDLKSILKDSEIHNERMLENMLDILVGEGILLYTGENYCLGTLKKIDITEAENFLNSYYKESLEWINFVNQYSENTLTTGKPSELTGFEEEKAIYYWNKIMEQSPHSLRVIAITELYKDLKPYSLVLDYGCGGGVGLEQLIELSNKPVTLIGTDPSTKFFLEAKKRIKDLNFEDEIRRENQKNIKFEEFDNLNNYLEKFDAIFISIIFNHIWQKDHLQIFKQLNSLLKNHGKLVVVQLLDFGKFNRNPIWVMHNIPSHKGYPMKDQFIADLKSTFSSVEIQLDGMISVSTK